MQEKQNLGIGSQFQKLRLAKGGIRGGGKQGAQRGSPGQGEKTGELH